MKVIITGGAGFIGINAASRYLARGNDIVLLDNLSRAGAGENLEWLRPQGKFTFAGVDIRDAQRVRELLQEHRDADLILHLAGQVAVTTSLTDPRGDFEVNALGTFNILDAVREIGIAPPLIYASTNKVYGALENVSVIERDGRYAFADLPYGVSEEQPLDFHSPYGCSKGAADQYVHDYHRIYGLRTVVFRLSCIYGYRQFGIEDQGWVAWFTIAACLEYPLTVYGDGNQVRDILFIDDLLDAFDAAYANVETAAGRVYNIGGGPSNILSPHDLLTYLKRRKDRSVPYRHAAWRPGDQKVFVSDIRRAGAELGWTPRVGCEQGLALLYDWVASNERMFR